MSAAKPQGSKRQRKTAYAALANKGSRNQDALSGPIIGHFETVSTETRYRLNDEGGIIGTYEKKVKPYQRIVHDEVPRTTDPSLNRYKPQRSIDPQKRRRQESAWKRCRVLRENGAHAEGRNCYSCGCPEGGALEVRLAGRSEAA